MAQLEQESAGLIPLAAAQQKKLVAGQRALRGLFAGGTFCYEAQLILRNLPEPIYSNAPLVKDHRLGAAGAGSPGPYHTCSTWARPIHPRPPAPDDRSDLA